MPKDMPVTQGLHQCLLVKGMMVLEAVLEIQTIANSKLISIATKLTLGPNPVHQDLAAELRAQEKVDKLGKEPPLPRILTRPVGSSCPCTTASPGPGSGGQTPPGLVLQG
ncbi:hypothetical protein P7K49_034918 [Saguinus oedipus]|uniref:Uncharacterized protein n=1 Tax=Saguinus oedipus TaxID=9490 RepID=A0ABQ9TW25_SAGOE|nr:hypothetical protein P7K49_034918 [Saguinus oedipus]